MEKAYREDLAYVHDAGFGGLARNAAPVLLEVLRRAGIGSGRVVELGCGSGILSEGVAAGGYDVEGIDISTGMIALARRRVPQGRFRVDSLLTAELPPCVAVAAVGEVVNYLFDPSNTRQALGKLFRRIFEALCPGGVLLFDAAGPGRVPGEEPRKVHAEGDDWAVLATAEEDRKKRLLTRRITTFRKVGELYRRDHEVHQQRLYPPAELATLVRRTGFRVRRLRGYGPLKFPPGLVGFLGRKPWKFAPTRG